MVVQHGPLRIGVIHGHQVVPLGDAEMLAATARKMDVDVLISGGTHRSVARILFRETGQTCVGNRLTRPWPSRDRFEAFESDGRFFLNPGSATGAFTPLWTPTSPSAAATATTAPADSSASDASNAASGAASENTASRPQGSSPTASESDTKEENSAGTNGAGGKDAGSADTPTAAAADTKLDDGPTPSFALLDIQGNVVVT